MALGETVTDGLEEVRFPEPHAPVDEQRVIRDDGRLRDRQAGGLGKLIRGADDECLEAVTGIEVGWRRGRERYGGRWKRRGAVDREDQLRSRTGDGGDGGGQGLKVALLEVLTEKLIRDA